MKIIIFLKKNNVIFSFIACFCLGTKYTKSNIKHIMNILYTWAKNVSFFKENYSKV